MRECIGEIMKTIVLKVRNLPNNVDVDLFVYCMQQDVAVPYPRGKVELVPDMGEKRDVCEIVRCKDCKHGEECVKPHKNYWCHLHDAYQYGDWFCADGERK